MDQTIAGVGPAQTLECPADPLFSEPTASDGCDPSPVLTFQDLDLRDACGVGTVTRTWTARDCAGNTSTRSQSVTVTDTAWPVIVGVGPNQTIECPARPVFSDPTVSDACGAGATLTFADAADYDKVRGDDVVDIVGVGAIADGGSPTVVLHHSDGTTARIATKNTISREQFAWFVAGSALNQIRAGKA